MNVRRQLAGRIERTVLGRRLLRKQQFRSTASAVLTFGFHLLYALLNGALGIACRSMWFMILCAYYVVLSAMRFSVVRCIYRSGTVSSADTEYFVMKLCGLLLVVLSIVMAGTNYISLSQNIAIKRDEIVMITIAAYTFSKLTVVIVKAAGHRKNSSPLSAVLRTISYAEIAASILSLQRSMLVSFGGMEEADIRRMNILSGSAAFLFVLILGFAMVRRGQTDQIERREQNERIEAGKGQRRNHPESDGDF